MRNMQLSVSTSNRLHALRWSAAFVVLLGHVEMVGKWRTGMSVWPWAYQMAHLAVMAFFVLSGFIISYVAFRAKDLSGYMLERVTRIYSVLVPAVFLTVAMDMIGTQIRPDFYGIYAPQSNYLFRMLVNLLGVQGWQGHRVQFGTNSPLWSIGYEMFFYVAFGVLLYKVICKNQQMKQRFIWLLSAIVLMVAVGYEMVVYSLIWSLGALAYQVRLHFRLPKFGFFIGIAICYVSFVTIAPGYLMDLLFSCGLFMLLLSNDCSGYGLKFNEFLANFSYSLYATHLPVMFFVYAIFWHEKFNSVVFSLGVVVVCLVFAYGFSLLFEKRRYVLRSYLKKLFLRIPLVSIR